MHVYSAAAPFFAALAFIGVIVGLQRVPMLSRNVCLYTSPRSASHVSTMNSVEKMFASWRRSCVTRRGSVGAKQGDGVVRAMVTHTHVRARAQVGAEKRAANGAHPLRPPVVFFCASSKFEPVRR